MNRGFKMLGLRLNSSGTRIFFIYCQNILNKIIKKMKKNLVQFEFNPFLPLISGHKNLISEIRSSITSTNILIS